MSHTPEKDEASAWRDNREPGWHRDVGYALENALSQHHYDLRDKGSKPTDPGWHACTCGWEGYWSSFNPHVADHLRARVTRPVVREHRFYCGFDPNHDGDCGSVQ